MHEKDYIFTEQKIEIQKIEIQKHLTEKVNKKNKTIVLQFRDIRENKKRVTTTGLKHLKKKENKLKRKNFKNIQ